MSTLVIAEAGVNHNGDIGLARELIAAAAEAGADVVKFQTFVAAKMIARDAAKADYQKTTTGSDENQYDMVRKLELSRADHEILIEEAARHRIEFFSTAFDLESAQLLRALGLTRVKIPSGEITNMPLIRDLVVGASDVILSTGMANLGEIEATIDVIEAAGIARTSLTLLHCTTEYPAPMDEVNLRAMQTIGRAFDLPIGYSDHTRGIEIPIAAVALGAIVIEKHFTMDCGLPGPDHRASLEPDEMRAMVAGIRNVERALGDGIKRPTPSELKNKPIARKSLVASRPITAGEAFTPENVDVKRPGTGLSPMLWDSVMGRVAKRAFTIDEMIEL